MSEGKQPQRRTTVAPHGQDRTYWQKVADLPMADVAVLWPLFVLITGSALITRAVFASPSWTVIAVGMAIPATVLVPATVVFLHHWYTQRTTWHIAEKRDLAGPS